MRPVPTPRAAAAVLAAALAALPGLLAADAHSDGPFAAPELQYGQIYRGTTLLGTRIHAVDADIEVNAALPAGTVAEWDDIGEIGDLLIGVDGTLEAVVVDVGGFLGLGEKEVAITWDALRGVREDDDPEEWFLGVTLTEADLEAAPALERAPAPEQ